MRRVFPAFLAGSMAAVLIGTAGAQTPAPGQEEFGLTERELSQRVEKVEALIAQCMREQGFQYIAVDFKAFVDFVNQMDGIVLEVPERIEDPNYPDNCYGYDPFTIDPGLQRLDGETALKYARTRATFGGDVDRAARQQQVILAVREQATQLDRLPQLILSAPQLWSSYQNNVTTNLELNEALQLANLVRTIPPESMRNVVLNFDYVYNDTTFDGQQVLVPIRDSVRALRDELFAPPAVPTPIVEALPTAVTIEEARVAVYNGTETFGLAAETQNYLRRQNVNVTEIGNADSAT